jgi:hypothetical protein
MERFISLLSFSAWAFSHVQQRYGGREEGSLSLQ